MKSTKIFLLCSVCALFFAVTANAQDINQAIEFYNKGAEAVLAKDWATAISQYNKALTVLDELGAEGGEEGEEMTFKIKEVIPNLHLFLGKDLAVASKIEEAIVELNKAIEKAEEYDDFGTAALEAKKLIDQLNFATAKALFDDKNYEEAISAFNKVLEAEPNNGTAYFIIGASYAALNNETQAIVAYEKAIEMGNKDAASRLANIYLTQAQNAMKDQKWQNMYDLSTKAAVIAPDNANVVKFIGIAAFQLKKYNEAIPALEKTLAANPNAADKNGTIYRLAQAFEAQNKNSQACGYYKQLLNDANYKQMAEHKIKNVLKCP